MPDTPPTASATPAAPSPAAPAADLGGIASQNEADAILAQLEANHTAVGEAVQAVQQATQSADELAAVAQLAQSPAAGLVPDGVPLKVPPIPPEIQRLLAIEVPVIVQLGTRRLSVGEVMRFAVGAIIEFHKAADEDLDLLANNRLIGKGQAVKVGENFGIKLTAVGPVKETIRALGGV